MGYAVLHLDKAKGNEVKMTAHIERKQMPANAVPELTCLNEELIEFPTGVTNRTEAIEYRLNHAGLTRKIGSNQVRAIRIMLTGSNIAMKCIEAEGRIKEWCADNLDWLCNTFGRENIVSAVLHRDEATPHIHATVIPIVMGERRKISNKQPHNKGKKSYRKKPDYRPRLCADDIMTRTKLKSYQDSYADAMKKYGLERGIVGSEARHITTQEFYRNAIAQQQDLQDNIDELLKIEEQKRQALEEFTRQELTLRSNLRKAKSELKTVKAEIKTGKLKNAASEVGSTIMEGIGSIIGTSQVKRQQQEINSLHDENQSQQQKIDGLIQTIHRERAENVKIIKSLQDELHTIYHWLPDTKPLIRMGQYCRTVGFSDDMVKTLLNMKPIYFSGSIYSHEHKQHFETKKSKAQLVKDPNRTGVFRLLIDAIDIVQWFREKRHKLLLSMGIEPIGPKQKRGINI